jgi:hypothetical protein
MLQACAQAVDFKGGHHFGERQDAGDITGLKAPPIGCVP